MRWSRSQLPRMRQWPEDTGQERPRVLVESPDGAILGACTWALERSGYAVATCETPESVRHGVCPLVTEGRCPLAEAADVVVHATYAGRKSSPEVIAAYRERLPDTPVIVEVPAPAIERHAAALSGCQILELPMTAVRLVAAVDDATLEAAAHD